VERPQARQAAILERAIDKQPEASRILIAQFTGTVRHHAKRRRLTADVETAAVAELRELASGRSDLLADVAGVMEGFAEGELDEPLARQAAQMCRLAGADEPLIPQWIAEGKRRSEIARMPPYSGPPYGYE